MPTDNFDKIAKEGNILDRIEQAERRGRSTTRKNVASARLSNLSPEMGEVEYRAVDVDGNLRMVMSAYDLFDELGVHAHFAGLNASGVVQVYLSADDGQVHAAANKVILGANGIVVEAAVGASDSQSEYKFSVGVVPNVGGMGMYMSGGDSPVLTLRSDSDAVGGGKAAAIYIEAIGDAGDVGIIKIRTFTQAAELGQLNVGGTAIAMKATVSELVVNNFPYATGEAVFNEQGSDINHRFEGDTDPKLWVLDAGLDAAAIGGDPESGYKLKVHGNVNLSSGSLLKINGTTVLKETTRPIVTHATHWVSATIPASTSYFCMGYVDGNSGTVERAMPVLRAGTVKNFYVRTTANQPASGSLVFMLRKNLADTTITMTCAAGVGLNTTHTDLVHTVSVVPGDFVGVKITNNATAPSAPIGFVAFEIECDP